MKAVCYTLIFISLSGTLGYVAYQLIRHDCPYLAFFLILLFMCGFKIDFDEEKENSKEKHQKMSVSGKFKKSDWKAFNKAFGIREKTENE